MKPRILIADHERGLVEAMQRCLASRGYQSAIATDGLQCLHEIRLLQPSFLVLGPNLLWGGAEGIMDWLRTEKRFPQPTVVVVHEANGSCNLQEFSTPSSFQLSRPKSIKELLPFISQLEFLAWNNSRTGYGSLHEATHA